MQIILSPTETLIIKSKGKYAQELKVWVLEDGTINYRGGVIQNDR
jgi:hypothetical protein